MQELLNFTTISILEGYIKSQELNKESLIIVDLMAGDGYLTKFLINSGFKNIHAIEACNEMYFDFGYL